MKVIKKFFRFISLTVLYLGFSCLAGVLGILLYGVTSDFVLEYKNLRAPASVQSDPPSEVTNRAPISNRSNSQKFISAAEVTDKNSLKSFVLAAKKHLEEDYDTAVQDFRTQDRWKTKLIYLAVLDLSGNILLSANYPEWEGDNGMEWRDPDGKKAFEDMINLGKKGGGFYKYRSYHPDKEYRPRMHYTTNFKKNGKKFIVYSGFFL